jgi:two-component system NtrC family sensor kinase
MSHQHPIAIPALIRQRRYWLLLWLLWAAAVAVALRIHVAHLREQSIQVAAEGARNVFRMVMLTRSWNEQHGGVYLLAPTNTAPTTDATGADRDPSDFTRINPAHMTRLISELAASDAGSVFHMTSLNPLRPDNQADAWESASLRAFESGAKEIISIEPSPGGDLLRYMAPLQVQPPCMVCHAHQGYRVGDVRGGISVTQRYAPIAAPTELSIRQSALAYGTGFVMVSLAGWLLLELLRRRWRELLGKIEELNATRGELVQSEKMASLGRMVAGFAHEINTPVGVAVGAVSQHDETLNRIDTLLSTDDVNEVALRSELSSLRLGGALALSNLRRAASLVQSFKRTSIDQSSDEVRTFCMKELIEDVLFSLHNQLKHLPVSVKVECADGLSLQGAPGLLEQLLTNLLMNAIQHAFADGQRAGEIVIQAERDGSELQLLFTDNGVGMNAEHLARVFEPFYTTRRGQGGSGLGLYICYNIITVTLGGSIQCLSSPGNGCRFEVRIPARFVDDPRTH